MKIIIQIGQLLLSLSILIILHEMGHFIFARIFKTRVEKFYLFFDPWFSLFKVKKGDTEFGIGWLPLGGYVKISGMIDESMDKEAMEKPPQPYEFRSKPAWQRLLIMLGGVLVNLVLAFFIYTLVLFTWGEKYLPNENLTDGIWVTDTLMHEMGFRTGDKILSVDETIPDNFSGMFVELFYGGEIKLLRGGRDTSIYLPENFAGRIIDNSIHNAGIGIYPRIPFIISEIPDTSINAGAGLKPRDRIIRFDNQEIKYADEILSIRDTIRDRAVPVVVDREGEQLELSVIVDSSGMLGIVFGYLNYTQLEKLGVYSFATKEYTFLEAIPAGFQTAKSKLQSYIRQFKLIFNFKTGAYKGVGGFAAITNLFPAQWHWESFWGITAFLSLMLAFLNILPIPALDGGHVTFLIFEMISGRKPGDKFLEYAQIVGMILLLLLLLYANGNDVYRGILRLIGK